MFYRTVNLTCNNQSKVILKIKKADFFERLEFFKGKGRLLRQILKKRKNTEGSFTAKYCLQSFF